MDYINIKNIAAHLVERNPAPNGYQLLNPNYVGKHDAYDLVTLAAEIQRADVAVNNHSGKLSLILDQVSDLLCKLIIRLLSTQN